MNGLSPHSLNELNFEEFLEAGFIIQSPENKRITLGLIGALDNLTNDLKIYVSNFYLTQLDKINPSMVVNCSQSAFCGWITSNNLKKLKLKKTNDFDSAYREDAIYCKNAIQENKDLSKLVAVTMAEYEASHEGHPIFNIIESLDDLSGSLYGLWQNNKGFIGVSPEPLFIKTKDFYKTIALAGTIETSNEHYKKTILNDPKENNEHQKVVEDIILKLNNKASVIDKSEIDVFNFGPLAHLKTQIRFQTSSDIETLIKTLSPTAALGGFPSKNTFNFLKKLNYFQLQKESRMFGGVMGIQNIDDCFSLVKIRNIFWEDKIYQIHSGSGIVSDSIIDKEVLEVQKKRLSIERYFL